MALQLVTSGMSPPMPRVENQEVHSLPQSTTIFYGLYVHNSPNYLASDVNKIGIPREQEGNLVILQVLNALRFKS